jgi:hypothetical protein
MQPEHGRAAAAHDLTRLLFIRVQGLPGRAYNRHKLGLEGGRDGYAWDGEAVFSVYLVQDRRREDEGRHGHEAIRRDSKGDTKKTGGLPRPQDV